MNPRPRAGSDPGCEFEFGFASCGLGSPVDLDLPPVDLGLGALQCMGFGIGKFFGETSGISMAISF